MLNALSQINIELTSRCNKSCYFCGHQNPKVNTALEYGDIDINLLVKIAEQLPPGIIVQFHRDGEPLYYPHFKEAMGIFCDQIRSIVTNGKLLVEKADEIIDRCETVTVSVFDKDPDGDEQLAVLRKFLVECKGSRKPVVNVKIVGTGVDEDRFKQLGVAVLHRSLHSPGSDTHYKRSQPPIPEVGICLDFLSHPSVDWRGDLYICNRLDVGRNGLLGNLNGETLDSLWNSQKRKTMMSHHIDGRRDLANALCAKCEFYGIPTNG
jgi:MoaA/NifB/PqqE/SkfB family radical SAM enzyme